MLELKRISKEAVPGAIEKAKQYRALNEPLVAESICRDILEVDRENREVLILLLLALTDQFDHRMVAVTEARELLAKLSDYERHYYGGIIFERRAKAHLKQTGPGVGEAALGWLEDAMRCYGKAEALRPPGNDDAILRWNTCLRIIGRDPRLEAARASSEPPSVELE